MKVIDGNFGMKAHSEEKVSDMFQTLADASDALEEDGKEIQAVVVFATDEHGTQVLTTGKDYAKAHFLLTIGATALTLDSMGEDE